MKYLVFALTLTLSALSYAGDGRHFGIQAPADWTPVDPNDAQPGVSIDSWFTEGATVVTQGVFIGPLLAGAFREIDGVAFLGSGRTICLNATAERTGQAATRVTAVPACGTFPLYPIAKPTLLGP
jgi:hypothetical protein